MKPKFCVAQCPPVLSPLPLHGRRVPAQVPRLRNASRSNLSSGSDQTSALPTAQDELRLASAALRAQKADGELARLEARACDHGGDGVQDMVLCLLGHLGWQRR